MSIQIVMEKNPMTKEEEVAYRSLDQKVKKPSRRGPEDYEAIAEITIKDGKLDVAYFGETQNNNELKNIIDSQLKMVSSLDTLNVMQDRVIEEKDANGKTVSVHQRVAKAVKNTDPDYAVALASKLSQIHLPDYQGKGLFFWSGNYK